MHCAVRLLFAVALLLPGQHADAQTRVAVSALLSTTRPDTTSLIQLPSGRIEASVPVNLARGAFTGTGRYFIAVNEDLRAAILLQLWVVDLQTGAIWTQDLPGYNGAYVIGHPRLDEAYLTLTSGFVGTLAVVRPVTIYLTGDS